MNWGDWIYGFSVGYLFCEFMHWVQKRLDAKIAALEKELGENQ